MPAGSAAPAGKVLIGDYEARATPISGTDAKTAPTDTATLTAGTYKLLFQAPGYGLIRTTLTVTAGRRSSRRWRSPPTSPRRRAVRQFWGPVQGA